MSTCPICGASGDALFSNFACSNVSCANHAAQERPVLDIVSLPGLKPGEVFWFSEPKYLGKFHPSPAIDFVSDLKIMEERIYASLGIPKEFRGELAYVPAYVSACAIMLKAEQERIDNIVRSFYLGAVDILWDEFFGIRKGESE